MLARTKIVILCAALGAGTAFAQDKPAAPPAAGAAAPAPAMDPKMAAEMKKHEEAMMKAGTPGPEHEKLKALAGTYDAKVTMWMDPKMPPMEMAGKSENKLILGGRFLQMDFSGTMMGQPFNGIGMLGYDNIKKKYTSSWMDSMSTSVYGGEGIADKEGVITINTSMMDPVSGKAIKGRDVWKPGASGYTFEMWGPPMGGKGKEVKHMEITYTKK